MMKNNNEKDPAEEAVEQFFTSKQENPVDKTLDISRNNTVKTQRQNRKKTKFDENGQERKEKRRNLLILPSLYKEIEKIAYVEKISANEAINRAIELYCKRNKNKLGLYARIEEMKANNESEKVNTE